MNRTVPLAGLLLVACLSLVPGLRAGERKATVISDRGLGVLVDTDQVEVRWKRKRLLLYVFQPAQFKPYVKELYTLKGDNVLQDAPPDHLHHHGLMYAIKVNGVNFWEETPQAGLQRGGEVLAPTARDLSDGRSLGHFTQRIYWVPGTARELPDPASAALLVEERRITVTVEPTTQEVAVQWDATFQAGRGTDRVTLTGSHYHGLGLRLPAAFDGVATRLNSEGAPYLQQGRDEVTPARWSAMSHAIGKRPVTVALFDRPTNPGGGKFFSMLNGFAYLAATQGLDKTALTYGPGESFSLSYLVTVSPMLRPAESLRDRAERWVAP